MEENMYQSCLEPNINGSDNEKASTFSSKDGSSNFDQILAIKSEHFQYEEFSEVNSNYVRKSADRNNTFKKEKLISNCENGSTGSKKRQLFKCPHCPKVFSNSSAIAKHKLTHSDERKYACEMCGKAFKRQDHLNGHKHTHKTNKPHACHLCDRSYSDARSLRRHYENQHQNEFLKCREQNVRRDSGGSSLDESGSADVFGILDETKCIRCDVCSKGFKNQSALNGHMRLHGGYGQTKDCITGPGEPKPLAPFIELSAEKIDVVSVTGTRPSSVPSSSRMSNIVIITSVPTEGAKSQLHSLLTMRPSITTISQEHADGGTLPTISSTNLQDINMDELCQCLSPSSNSANNNHGMGTHEQIHANGIINEPITSIAEGHMSSQHQHYSPITPAFVTHGNSVGHMFNYPTTIDDSRNLPFDAVATDQYQHQQYSWDNTQSSYISSADQQIPKQWSYFPDSISDTKPTSSQLFLPRHPSSTNIQDLIMNLDSIDPCSNLDLEWSKFSEGNEDTNVIAESSENESFTKRDMMESIMNNNSDISNISTNNIIINNNLHAYSQSTVTDSLSSSLYKQSTGQEPTLSSSHKKNKCRPAPIFIPPQTSAHMSRLRSPRVWNTTEGKEVKIPPYTPPPMLSPQRKGSGLFNSVWYGTNRVMSSVYQSYQSNTNHAITVMSNSRCNDLVVSSRSLSDSQISSAMAYSPVLDKVSSLIVNMEENPLGIIKRNGEPEHFLYQDECQPQLLDEPDGLPTSATPRINIGSQYQTALPKLCYDKRELLEDKRIWDTLLWDPKQFKDTVENTSSLDLLMKIASSPAVKSCGLNMEYTFHLLCKYKGDLEKTLQALLEDSFVVYDYVYAETTIWKTDEILKFQERLKKHDRDFMRVARDLKLCGMNKSVKACVEFYYVWKQMNNVKDINRFRIKPSRKKIISVGNNILHDDTICATNIDGLKSTQATPDCGYNLRKNQKVYVSHPSYGYRTSSDSSSREQSPMDYKPHRTISSTPMERMKKSQMYHCSQCKKRFTKSKTLENHMRNHKGPTATRDKVMSR